MQIFETMKDQYTRILAKYIPEKAVETVYEYMQGFGFHLKITKDRTTKLGDFRPNHRGTRGHQITVNFNLNPYAFLITLIHEVAHLKTWNTYTNKVKPHGEEWKRNFQSLMQPLLNQHIFPEELLAPLHRYLFNPAASSCTDEHLMKCLRRFDKNPGVLLEEIPPHSIFRLYSGRIFKKGVQRRKYFECEELNSKKRYLISPLAEVEPLSIP